MTRTEDLVAQVIVVAFKTAAAEAEEAPDRLTVRIVVEVVVVAEVAEVAVIEEVMREEEEEEGIGLLMTLGLVTIGTVVKGGTSTKRIWMARGMIIGTPFLLWEEGTALATSGFRIEAGRTL